MFRLKKSNGKSSQYKKDDALTKTIAKYGASNLVYQILGVGNALLKPKLLKPELLGLWSLLSLIPRFAPYIHLGSRTAMRYQLPRSLAKGDQVACSKLMGATYFGTLALNSLSATVLILYAFTVPMEETLRWGICTMAGLIILFWFYEYQISVLKSFQKFNLLSRINYLRGGILSILNIILITTLGIYGLYIALFSSYLLIILYLRSQYTPPAPAGYNHKVFLDLIRQGFPIMIYNLGGLLINSSDKIIISTLLGLKQLGYYGIASITLNFLMQVPGASREVVESKLIEYMEENKEDAAKLYILRPLTVTAYLIPFFIGSGFFLLPDAVTFFFPNYLPGVKAAQFILFGGFPLSLSYVLRGGIVACNIQAAASFTMIISAIFNFLFSYLLVQKGWGINGVALSSVLSFFLLFLLQQTLLAKKFQFWNSKKILPLLMLPFIFMTIFCFGAKKVFSFLDILPIYKDIGAILIYCFLMRFIYNIAACRTGAFQPLSFTK